MEVAIGVFTSRERAEEAVTALRQQNIPQDEIVFLTRSESEATSVGKELFAAVGGSMGFATGMSVGVVTALLLVPGIGEVFALGFGAATLLGLAGVGVGSAVGKAVTANTQGVSPTPEETLSEDASFLREVLAAGRSLIIVRTKSTDTANAANEILNRLGIGIREHVPMKMQMTTRQVADIVALDVQGRITAGEGNLVLRNQVRELLDRGNKKILLNLHEVGYVDSSGLGELVRTLTTVQGNGGQLKLVQISQRVQDLLQMTKLHSVFDIHADEASAIQSFST